MYLHRHLAILLLGLLLVACNNQPQATPTLQSTARPPAATPTQPAGPASTASPGTAEQTTPPAVERPIIQWTAGGQPCQTALINLESVAAGGCETELATIPLSDQRRTELAAFLAIYYDFQANTAAGQVLFTNSSPNSLGKVAEPAEQRMIAEWARAVAVEAQDGPEAAPGPALAWRREGDSLCQDLVVYLTGWATASSCAGGGLERLGSGQLGLEQLEQLYAVVDDLQSFTAEMAGAQTVTLAGQGRNTASATLQEELGRFATGLFAVLAAGASQAAAPQAEPFATAPFITFGSWSPDGAWLAYWASSEEDMANQEPAASPGGTLYFANVADGESCAVPQFTTRTAFSSTVSWIDDNTAVIVTPDGAFSGRPCQAEPFAATDTLPVSTLPDPALSPDGRLRATTTQTASADGVLTFETVLAEVNLGQTLQNVTWQIDQRLGEYGLGGQWVSPEQFLVRETLDEGPLLVHATEGATPVLTELFGLAEIPSLAEEAEGYLLGASAAPDSESNSFHLLTYGVGLEGRFPPTLLYHAENDQVETLPYRKSWGSGFSADGQWLLLYEPVFNEGYESGANLWVRGVEDVGGAWQLAAADAGYLLWPEDGSEVAYSQRETTIYWQSFPGGEPVGVWQTGEYWTIPAAFSPDGRYLATVGNIPGLNNYALFLLERP
ncbi:MAG: hypothetical protein L0332_18820 [Chloroflexi bacterium]|nr:hypothetical protein [Chloroflexota bacterium]MCI0576244.1 hypothetical protein [Chloroflexota bacterium]MCI0644560.1 hypothetical protein [Chloroflexota bacterium]MCI0728751.1 hypothetical protein [Chloroflexota bacterium]